MQHLPENRHDLPEFSAIIVDLPFATAESLAKGRKNRPTNRDSTVMKPVIAAALSSFVVLAACDGENPFQVVSTPIVADDPTEPFTEEELASIPEGLSGSVTGVTFAPGSNTITVTGLPLDQVGGTFPEAVFNANTNLNVPGYTAYAYQDDNLDRMFVMLIAEDTASGVQAGAVADGGQFAEFFGGGFYRQIGPYTPDTGLVSYGGTYAGVSNVDANGNELLPPPAVGPAIAPEQPAQIVGDIFINADFGQNTVNGGIENVEYFNLNAADIATFGTDLPDVLLVSAPISAAGEFQGLVQNPGLVTIGGYGGTFGGTGATGVGGTMILDGDWDPNRNGEFQYGVFVLTQCGEPGDAPICATVN
jgi:hypothetical protein